MSMRSKKYVIFVLMLILSLWFTGCAKTESSVSSDKAEQSGGECISGIELPDEVFQSQDETTAESTPKNDSTNSSGMHSAVQSGNDKKTTSTDQTTATASDTETDSTSSNQITKTEIDTNTVIELPTDIW